MKNYDQMKHPLETGNTEILILNMSRKGRECQTISTLCVVVEFLPTNDFTWVLNISFLIWRVHISF